MISREREVPWFNITRISLADPGGAHPVRDPPKGPNSFVLTYKFYEM